MPSHRRLSCSRRRCSRWVGCWVAQACSRGPAKEGTSFQRPQTSKRSRATLHRPSAPNTPPRTPPHSSPPPPPSSPPPPPPAACPLQTCRIGRPHHSSPRGSGGAGPRAAMAAQAAGKVAWAPKQRILPLIRHVGRAAVGARRLDGGDAFEFRAVGALQQGLLEVS
eukprot:scaffold27875_cov67-Phaeocystis_antarctica.AAC.5